MRDKITFWILDRIADAVIKFLERGGFTIINRNDAAMIFREGADRSDFVFPWHLIPDDEYLKEHPGEQMPDHLSAATVFGFLLRKNWLMKFIAFYSAHEDEVDANMGHLQEILDDIQRLGHQHQHAPVSVETPQTGEIVH